MPEIIWTRGADSDLLEVYQALEEIREGAGDEFLVSVNASIEMLKGFPRMASVFEDPFRRLFVGDNRHHGVFYSVESRGIVIHAVIDLRRDLAPLRARLRKLRQSQDND